MIKLYFLFKYVNLVLQREYWGVHATDDLEWATTHARDRWVPNVKDIKDDLLKTGPNSYIIHVIHCFPIEADANRALQRHLETAPADPALNYNKALNNKLAEGRTGTIQSAETRLLISKATTGEKNPFYGKKHNTKTINTLKEYRKTQRWINNGIQELQVPVGTELPEGWVYGRSPTISKKVSEAMVLHHEKKRHSNVSITKSQS